MAVAPGDLIAAFGVAEQRAELLAPGAISVHPLGGTGACFAGVDVSGEWSLIIRGRKASSRLPSLRLASLMAEYDVDCVLEMAGRSERVRASVIRCRSDKVALRNVFANFASALMLDLPLEPDGRQVAESVNRWVGLFWRLQNPPTSSLVGFIGELVVLSVAADADKWVAAWHRSATDAIDFVFEESRLEIEVKATTGQERVHSLGLRQVLPGAAPRYFASVKVELRDSGSTVGEFAQVIIDKLSCADARMFFWAKTAQACGHQLNEYMESRFHPEISLGSILYYPAAEVPAPDVVVPLPVGVSDLRFRSDFSSACAVGIDEIMGKLTDFG